MKFTPFPFIVFAIIAVGLFLELSLNDFINSEIYANRALSLPLFPGLKDVEIPCMTVVPASGTGLQKSYTKIYRGTQDSLTLQNRIMIICIVSDENVEKCVDTILNLYENQNCIYLYNKGLQYL